MKKRVSTNSGQVFSTDIIFAFTVFIIMAVFLMSTWNFIFDVNKENNNRIRMELLCMQITEQLVMTQGLPINWERAPENVTMVGLAKDDRVIDIEKLEAFMSIDYNTTKEILKTFEYDYYLVIEEAGYTKGVFPSSDEITLTKRIVIYNNQPDTLVFYLWRR
jgi:hypothetical protein